jgi:hypothetical protein
MTYVHHRPVPLGLRLHRARRRWARHYPRTFRAARRLRANLPFATYALITFGLMAYVIDELVPLA